VGGALQEGEQGVGAGAPTYATAATAAGEGAGGPRQRQRHHHRPPRGRVPDLAGGASRDAFGTRPRSRNAKCRTEGPARPVVRPKDEDAPATRRDQADDLSKLRIDDCVPILDLPRPVQLRMSLAVERGPTVRLRQVQYTVVV
jgi:hypothetical protein